MPVLGNHSSTEKTLWEITRHFLFFVLEIVFLVLAFLFPFPDNEETRKYFLTEARYHLVVLFTGFPLAISLAFFYHAFRLENSEDRKAGLRKAGTIFLVIFLAVSFFIEKNSPGMIKTSCVEVVKFYKECISHMGDGYREDPCRGRTARDNPLFCS